MRAAAAASWAFQATCSVASDVARGAAVWLRRGDAPMATHYAVIGLSTDADDAQIKTAYRTLARRFHPDLNAGSAEAARRLAEINLAYETLGHPQSRAAYDRVLARRRRAAVRHYALLAASTTVTFTLTVTAVGYALRSHLQASHAVPPPEAAAQQSDAPVPSAVPVVILQGPREGVDLGPPPAPGDTPGWTTYRDAFFHFALRYPAGVLAFDPVQSDAHVHTLVSRDRQATLRIVATRNTSGISLASFRATLIKERYAGASFQRTRRQRYWFALSGKRGGEVFQERVTFSCDGKSMHGWLLRYPASQRASYDAIAAAMLRNHPHGNGPSGPCADDKKRSKRRSRRGD